MYALCAMIVLASTAAMVHMARYIVVHLRAEKKLVARLAEAPEVRDLLHRVEANGWPANHLPPRVAERLRAVVDREADRLVPIERRTIREAVYQPTVRGRENYLGKLLEESARELQHAH
jgi:hypothetical protein